MLDRFYHNIVCVIANRKTFNLFKLNCVAVNSVAGTSLFYFLNKGQLNIYRLQNFLLCIVKLTQLCNLADNFIFHLKLHKSLHYPKTFIRLKSYYWSSFELPIFIWNDTIYFFYKPKFSWRKTCKIFYFFKYYLSTLRSDCFTEF